MNDVPAYWQGRRAVIATMHGKERIIAPILESELGVCCETPTDFNTDVFGTFTREIPRRDSQYETAIKKARAAMRWCDADLAIASEGSFGPDPQFPLVTTDLELVVLCDVTLPGVLTGWYRAQGIRVAGQWVRSTQEAVEVATRWGFPQQGVIVRRRKDGARGIYKEVTDVPTLEAVVAKLLRRPLCSRVYLETDMRAHRHPGRRDCIYHATVALAENGKRVCPECARPGFARAHAKPGLPCEWCHAPTDAARAHEFLCPHCGYTCEEAVPDSTAPAGMCAYCNL